MFINWNHGKLSKRWLNLLCLLYVIKNLIMLLKEQQTLDLLELFNEDAEIIKNYFWETAITFFDETPKTNLILILIFITLILFLILLILQNYKKVVNKLTSLFHFYKSQRQ